jgi:hypothetical protein
LPLARRCARAVARPGGAIGFAERARFLEIVDGVGSVDALARAVGGNRVGEPGS